MQIPDKISNLKSFNKFFVLCLDFLIDEEKLKYDFTDILDPNNNHFPFDTEILERFNMPIEEVCEYIDYRKIKLMLESDGLDDDERIELEEELRKMEGETDEYK